MLERNRQSIQSVLRGWRPLLRYVFRCRISGLESLEDGPYLLVSNHNIGAAFEVMALLDAWETRFAGEKPLYGLAHRIAFRIPVVASLFRKIGAVPATYESGYAVLDQGASLAIFPGGNREVTRSFLRRKTCDFGGHRGWARIALSRGVPVVPVSITGSHSINPVLLRSQLLSTALILPRVLGIRWFPITASQLIYMVLTFAILTSLQTPPWGVALGCFGIFLSAVLWPVWPAQIKIHVGNPVDLGPLVSARMSESERLDICYREISRRVQGGMDLLNNS